MNQQVKTAYDSRKEKNVYSDREIKHYSDLSAKLEDEKFACENNIGILVRKGRNLYYVNSPVYREHKNPRTLVEVSP